MTAAWVSGVCSEKTVIIAKILQIVTKKLQIVTKRLQFCNNFRLKVTNWLQFGYSFVIIVDFKKICAKIINKGQPNNILLNVFG